MKILTGIWYMEPKYLRKIYKDTESSKIPRDLLDLLSKRGRYSLFWVRPDITERLLLYLLPFPADAIKEQNKQIYRDLNSL